MGGGGRRRDVKVLGSLSFFHDDRGARSSRGRDKAHASLADTFWTGAVRSLSGGRASHGRHHLKFFATCFANIFIKRHESILMCAAKRGVLAFRACVKIL